MWLGLAAVLALLSTAGRGGDARAPPAHQAPLRVMKSMGDSIRQWNCGLLDDTSSIVPVAPAAASFGGYRLFMFDSLQRQRIAVLGQPVGSMYDCGTHEGHSGWTCADLAAIARGAVAAHRLDVVQLMCGTNDLFYTSDQRSPAGSRGANATGTLARMAALLEAIFAAAPRVKLLLSTTTAINATRCSAYTPPCPVGAYTLPAMDELNAARPATGRSVVQRPPPSARAQRHTRSQLWLSR
jgi:hypothetical protein